MKEKRILIVDNNPITREVIESSLKYAELAYAKIEDPKEIIPKIRQSIHEKQPFDICLINVKVSDLGGYDAAREIRKSEESWSDLPLLAFTSLATNGCKKYRESGFNGFLPTPLYKKTLLKMIQHIFAKKGNSGDKKENTELVTQHSIQEDRKHSLHILIAEDNPINLKVAKYMLAKAGYQISVAVDGEQTVEMFSANPDKFDLILMDIQMPKMNGHEATRIIRKKGFQTIPIIATTADCLVGDREKCLESGMNDYIAKPIKREVVYQMVKKWCLERN